MASEVKQKPCPEAARNMPGNAAAMREVLMLYRKLFEDGVICTSYADSAAEMDELEELYHKTSAALSAPARNCDVYDRESCRMAYHLHGDGHMSMQAFADWLLAPAAERKGEGNERGN